MTVEASFLRHGEDDIEERIVGMHFECNCFECVHLHEDEETCDAYPDGVPTELLYGFVVHDRPHPGDHGIRFEPAGGRRATEGSGSAPESLGADGGS